MTDPLLLVTGFGPYEDVEENPSGRLVERLDLDPPAGVEIAARILPVSFRGSVAELDDALTALEPRTPAAILSLGVRKKGQHFRLERRAASTLVEGRPDILGVDAAELGLVPGPELTTTLDMAPLSDALRAGGADEVEVSDDAGGYVCERVYRHALERGAELGVPAVFLHVPALRHVSLAKQLRPVRMLVSALARQVAAPSA